MASIFEQEKCDLGWLIKIDFEDKEILSVAGQGWDADTIWLACKLMSK